MRVLFIDSYAPDDPDRRSAEVAAVALGEAGHEIRRVDLIEDGFTPYLTEAERRVYHDEDENILAAEVRFSTEAVQWADALMFCYPTVAFTVPAPVKGWFERVLLPGVSFGFDAKGKVVPKMTHIRRLGVVTSTPHDRLTTARRRDGGRRSVMWNLRLSCGWACRRTFVSVPAGTDREARIRRKLRRW